MVDEDENGVHTQGAQDVLQFLRLHGKNRPQAIIDGTGLGRTWVFSTLGDLVRAGMVRSDRGYYECTNVREQSGEFTQST